MRDIIQKCFNMTENFAERVKRCTESKLRNITKSVALLYLVSQSTNVIPNKYAVEALWLWLLRHISKQTILCFFNLWKFWKKFPQIQPEDIINFPFYFHKMTQIVFIFIFPHWLFLDFWSEFTFLCALSISVSEVQHSELDTML